MSKIKVRIVNPVTEWSKYTSVARALRYLESAAADVVRGTLERPEVIRFRVMSEGHQAAQRTYEDGPRGTLREIEGLPMINAWKFIAPQPRPVSMNYRAAVGLRLRSRAVQTACLAPFRP